MSSFFLSLENGWVSKREMVDLLNKSLYKHGLVGPITSWGPTIGRPDIVMTSVG